MVIFDEVARSCDHPDAETIFESVRKKVPTVSLDTVYRTLWMLNAMGLITTVGPPREKVRFDANVTPHHHFVCSRCGAARDVNYPEFDALKAPEELKGIGSVEAIRVELRGVCQRCAEQMKSPRHL